MLSRPALPADPAPVRLLFIGQDLDSIRGYFASGCCPAPDGVTSYLSLYDLRDPQRGYGGLGIDPMGRPLSLERDWGGGPLSAYKAATEFSVSAIAIGLSIAENDHPGALVRLVVGGYDAEIAHLGRFLASLEVIVYLRIGYEFEGTWNHGYDDAARFQVAWRRIVDGLRSAGASNVRYVWQTSASPIDDVLDRRHDDIARWYPGDDYVDWIAYSWFLHPDEEPAPGFAYRAPSARHLVDELLTFARQHGKPVMNAETAPQGYNLGEQWHANITPSWDGPAGENRRPVVSHLIWERWYAPMFEYLEANRDVIHAVAYINCNWDVQDLWNPPYESGFWGDTRLETNMAIARRFNEAIERWRQKN